MRSAAAPEPGAYEEALTAGRRAVALSGDLGWEGWAAATLGSALLDLRQLPVPRRSSSVAWRRASGRRSQRDPALPGQLAWRASLLGAEDEQSRWPARAEELFQQVSLPEGRAFLFGTHAYAAIARV